MSASRQETSSAILDKPFRAHKKAKYRYPEPLKAPQPTVAQREAGGPHEAGGQQQQQQQQDEELAQMTRSFTRSLSLNKSGRCRYNKQQASRQSVINNNDIYRPTPPPPHGLANVYDQTSMLGAGGPPPGASTDLMGLPRATGQSDWTRASYDPRTGSQGNKNTPPRRGYSTAL